MKTLIAIGLLFISNVIYSQSIQIVNDDDFTFKSNNQSFVLFKIRVKDDINYFSHGAIHAFPHIYKYDKFTGGWEDHFYSRKKEDYKIIKTENQTIYETTYLLEIKPQEEGYFFEYFSIRNSRNAAMTDDDIQYLKPERTILMFRKIAPENNRFYNYGTIELTINKPDSEPAIHFLNNEIEKANLINYAETYYPNIYNAYKDKISDDEQKFFFTVTTTGEINLKSTLHYWYVNNESVRVSTYGGVSVALGRSISFNSKAGEKPKAYMSFNQIELPHNFNITYNSKWKKGEAGRAYGLIISNSDENKYFFYTTTNGESGISGTCNGSNEACEIRNKNAYTGILNKENNYRVEIRNKNATYFINDIKIGSFALNYDLIKNCMIGFMVEDKQKVEFDDFQIIEQ